MKIKNWEIPALILWMAMIFWFSSIPNLSSGLEEDFALRKLAHCLEYAVLAFLFFRVLSGKVKNFWSAFWGAIILSIIYAITDEYHQTFVFGRSGEIKDVLIDSVGVFAGLICSLLPRRLS